MITSCANTNPRCVEVARSSAPPPTGRRTAHQHSQLTPYVLHPTCVHTESQTENRLRVIYSHTEAQNHLFRKPHPLCPTSVFLLWSERKQRHWTTLCEKPSHGLFYVYNDLHVFSSYYYSSWKKRQKTGVLSSTLSCKASAPPVIPHHVPACLAMWWWCSCGWLGPPLTRPPGWQTSRLGA